MNTKPKILISSTAEHSNYTNAVEAFGGIAEAIYCPTVTTDYDGLILSGGSDIHPNYYNENINGAVNIDEQRDIAEFNLFNEFVKTGKPILGICRGHQLINIALGGSLHQDIETSDEHKRINNTDNVHSIETVENSLISRLYGKHFSVNSAHHQAVKQLGKNLKATAFHNKILEAFEHETLPIFGFQFHPERMTLSYESDNYVNGKDIFKYFTELCKKTAR